MHRRFFASLLVLLPALALAAQPQVAPAAAQDSCLILSASLLQNLQKGDFKAATAHFDARMKAGLGPQRISHAWQRALPQLFGEFKRAAAPREAGHGGNTIVITPLQFANAWAKMIVACNGKGQIAGWRILPGAAPGADPSQAPASATAWIGEAAVGAKTLPITVRRDGFVLKGVLDLPAGKGPFGVVDIIPGSGPVDINGNAGPLQFNMYKQLAAALVEAGWAVARVAKRGMPPSTGDGNHIVLSDQVADNLAIVEALRKNPFVNPERIVVAGHSIGGLIAPEVATKTKLAGLILLEAPGANMKKIITAQVLKAKRKAGAGATKLAATKAYMAKLYSLVAQAPPGATVSYGGKPTVFAHSPNAVQLFKSWFEQDPLATARKLDIPALVVQGGQDIQTPPGNGKRLAKALPDGTLLYLPRMGHDFTLEAAGSGKDATLAPHLVAGIVHWLKSL